MRNIKKINIKNLTYYFFDDLTNMECFCPNLLKLDKKLYENIDIYYIGYIAIKVSEYVKTNSTESLYMMIGKITGHIEKDGGKYLIF